MATAAAQAQPAIPIAQLLTTLRDRMAARGARGIHGIGRAFKNWDDDGNKKLNRSEAAKALAELGIPCNRTELDTLLDYFDRDHDGSISFDELLLGLRSDLSPRRLQLIEAAFRLFDTNPDGKVTLAEIEAKYDARRAPEVIAGTKTARQVLQEFLNSFEGAMGSGNKDGVVTLQEFVQYYTALSASFDTDDGFAQMMKSAWHIADI